MVDTNAQLRRQAGALANDDRDLMSRKSVAESLYSSIDQILDADIGEEEPDPSYVEEFREEAMKHWNKVKKSKDFTELLMEDAERALDAGIDHLAHNSTLYEDRFTEFQTFVIENTDAVGDKQQRNVRCVPDRSGAVKDAVKEATMEGWNVDDLKEEPQENETCIVLERAIVN